MDRSEDAVRARVRQEIAESLALDLHEVEPSDRLIDDLGAESIDFLDILFRLEHAFQIQIPQGTILDEARGSLGDADFENKGILTEAGLARLRDLLTEIPAEHFTSPMRLGEVPRLFTVETFSRLVLRHLAA